MERTPSKPYTPALDVVANHLRLALAWPEGRGRLAGFLGFYVLPYTFAMTAIPPLVYFFLGEHSSNVEVFSFLADSIGSTLCCAKIVWLQSRASTIIAFRGVLVDLKPMERDVPVEAAELNERCERRAGKLARRFVRVYSTLSVTAVFTMSMAVIRADPSARWLPVKFPRFIMTSTALYHASVFVVMVEMYVFPIAIGIFEGLFITLCLHIACKCDILCLKLQRVREFDGQTPSGTPGQTQEGDEAVAEMDGYQQLRECAKYHQLIIELHRKTESIYCTIALFQMIYILFGLGTPAFRILDKSQEVQLVEVVFSITYVGWTFCQLLTYCYFGDIVARSSARLAGACYVSFKPALTPRDRKLGAIHKLMPLRAQRPLHLTAGRMSNLTLKLFQDIMKRSYSLYSTVLRMRG